ncbi:preprotein translocase subunit SecY [Gulosibacter sp. 10]|uniref:preprotein translocase subunit SecY n=1 Tax=Gulosibacter sp. 10 TaxID=1255570 RepID=UPI00097F1473|nr:preprotein translocase subunit SecY [Gulosibacter sp. 10]SJM58618.1 Preprotein translocase secY subunit (TC 3.A.5.1.1) [Gulosibacter sp. 10]
MFSAISRVFKTPDLRRKILFTLGMIAIYRLGTSIPAPFVDYQNVQTCVAGVSVDGQNSLFNMLNMFSGGALMQLSIFALGIMPYITASIITQLLRVVIPHFEALHKEGQSGQAKLTQYTRYLTIGLAVLQSTTLLTVARNGGLFGANANPACSNVINFVPETTGFDITTNVLRMLLMIGILTAGTAVIMWFGELITERGIGNGMSLLIFTSIAASFPQAMWSLVSGAGGVFTFAIIIVLAFGVLVAVVFVEQSQRRVPVQYARRMIGRRTYGGQSTYIPIKVNQAGVIPVIFASSLLMIPALIAQFNQPAAGEAPAEWVVWLQNNFMSGDTWLYMVVYFLLTIGFAYFYVYIAFNPDEVAENMRKQGGFVPGIRAGQPTADYLSFVLNRITFPGSIYLGIIALLPLIALATVGANQNFPFGGASILILVGVGLETVKQIDAQLQQRNYEGLLR